MKYAQFARKYCLSPDEICLQIFEENKDVIKVKKPATAISKLKVIFEATLKLSNETGFQAMTLRQLSTECDIGLGALYAYIESKEHLAQMIVSYVVSSLQRVYAISTREYSTHREQLIWIIRCHLFLSEQLKPWFYFSFMDARYFHNVGRQAAKGGELYTEGLISDCLKAGIKSGEFRKVDSKMTAALIKPMMQDWYVKSWKYKSRRVSIDTYTNTVIDVVCHYVLQETG